ncbi:glycosyltransferase [Periweissella cryptocerci]|uniref:Glycosyltransferase n=1 Tax=Periweissella cryptocerci TaxID=2506420 RepID=A0A4P6YW79_9LACO|nr:glycosyltransferase [Periweissella cryptocerci]QBO37078.1 glycosyltransferase [Periweissella cryptocerci]
MSILVSIVVPVYNVEVVLSRCMESILNQTYSNLQIILVNDGSTDNSGNVCDEYAKKDSRVTVIHQKNQGLSAARNNALPSVKGKYLMFVDSDDFIDTNLISELVEAMNHSEAEMGIFDYKTVDGNDMSIISSTNFEVSRNNYGDVAWNKFYLTEFYLENKFLYPVGKLFEDTAITHVIYAVAKKKIKISGSYYYYVRNRSGAITSSVLTKDLALKKFEALDILADNINKYKKQISSENFEILSVIQEKSWFFAIIDFFRASDFSFSRDEFSLCKTKIMNLHLENKRSKIPLKESIALNLMIGAVVIKSNGLMKFINKLVEM